MYYVKALINLHNYNMLHMIAHDRQIYRICQPSPEAFPSLNGQCSGHGFVSEKFSDGDLVIARRVVECDGQIDGDRLLAHKDDAFEEFPFLLMVGTVDHRVTRSREEIAGAGRRGR